ncbi:uncharacterized protein BDZ99DRAFT_46958 [Mytilinidion resinicola]|uniref:NACHT domain-containing protein n=1 Tax=Mytilinidion resinicola TaxID=574789 RepID=A0A6A6YK12_9PEZI|nr:uncharacterized protein BDZ99DRAFT_46958 [Mytilinidion resinicola]KAF2809192.1 hypothetical protein BDZ99DRAFT_46958 [Mytilinidion resinicola]
MNPHRLEGTCQWVLQHENFRNWKNSSSSSLLWLSADPGCGKSVLSKSFIDEDFRSTDNRTTCYFFFKDDNDVQKNVATALSALLHQLFSQKPTLLKHAMSDYAANGDKLTQSFHTLWSILTKAVADPRAGEVFCVLDFLDECAEAGRYQIIEALDTFYQHASSGKNPSKLKMLVTSRPYLDIERRFTELVSKFPTIRLRGERESHAISREIDDVIKWRVSKLGSELKLNDSETLNLERELLGMVNRTYLWLTLILDIVRKTILPTGRKLKAIISTLPSTVDQVYEAILSRIEEDERLQAKKLLHIIVAAKRPLTLEEMNIALAIEPHHRSYDDLDLDDEARFEVSVRNLCGLFVTVVDQRVYLIHQTAKEFLLAKSDVATGRWKHSLIPTESETLMAAICVTYLSFSEFDVATDYASAAVEYGYLDYAAGFWVAHFRKTQDCTTKQMLQLVLKICNTRSKWFNT